MIPVKNFSFNKDQKQEKPRIGILKLKIQIKFKEMGEIIQLHLGNCGNQIGASFFEYIADEHGLDPQGNYVGESFLQKEKINTFFQPEVANSKYSARALLIDLDCTTLNSIRMSSQAKLFRQDNMINLKNGANNVWAVGCYTDGAEMIQKIEDQLRKEVELCDNFRGFQVVSSISAGTGGGLLSPLLNMINAEYNKPFVSTVSIMSSQLNSENSLAAYNNILSIPKLIEYPDQCIMVDNDSLHSLCENVLFIENASYLDLNHIVAGSLGILTGPMRFMSPLSSEFQSLIMNMNPLGKLHFSSISLAPLAAKLTPQFKTLTGFEVFQQMMQPSNFLTNIDFKTDKTLAAGAFFRGHMGDREVESLCSKHLEKNGDVFAKDAQKEILLAHAAVPPKGMKLAGSSLVNSTNFKGYLKVMNEKFLKMFKRKSFLHWYTGTGMDEMEFTESSDNVSNLISDYEGLTGGKVEEKQN